MIVADTSGLLALFNEREPAHEAVAAIVEGEPQPLIVSPYVVAELDYLVATRFGVDAELAVLAELAGGAYDLTAMSADDVDTCRSVIERYHDQEIGVVDASLVALADRYRTKTVLTLDHRHFDVVRPVSGGRFKVLP